MATLITWSISEITSHCYITATWLQGLSQSNFNPTYIYIVLLSTNSVGKGQSLRHTCAGYNTLRKTNITMDTHHFNGKSHYEMPCSIAMLNYQRVNDECTLTDPAVPPVRIHLAEWWQFVPFGNDSPCINSTSSQGGHYNSFKLKYNSNSTKVHRNPIDIHEKSIETY